jgi:hypothetical protein
MERRFGLLTDAIVDLSAALEAHSGAIRDAQDRSPEPTGLRADHTARPLRQRTIGAEHE